MEEVGGLVWDGITICDTLGWVVEVGGVMLDGFVRYVGSGG